MRGGDGLFEAELAGKKRSLGRPAAVDKAFRAFDPHQLLLLPPSLDDWLPRTKPGKAAHSRRKAIVEPVFGQIMTRQNGRQRLLRGEDGARGEWRLLAACHNLRKIIRHARTAGLAAAPVDQPGRAGPRRFLWHRCLTTTARPASVSRRWAGARPADG